MQSTAFRFCDELGPAKVVEIYQPTLGLRAVVVVDNVAAGPAMGGVRMAPDVSVEECFRLARAMTLKNAAAGLRHGGGKSVIVADPAMAERQKERLIRAFAQAIRDLRDYIPGPDMGTDERCMAWIWDEIGRAAALPEALGGIPIDELGATGFGLAAAAQVACEDRGLDLKGARIVVQGFGAVGRHAARFLGERGAVLVAASDTRGAVHDPAGLDLEALSALKREGRSVTDCPGAAHLAPEDLIGVDCEIWIPAARPDVIAADNVGRMKARVLLQGANIPATPDAERYLFDHGVLVVPDFIANAGGVICAAAEYHGASRAAAFQEIEDKIRHNTAAVLRQARADGQMPRAAATAFAGRRVRAAMGLRRWASGAE